MTTLKQLHEQMSRPRTDTEHAVPAPGEAHGGDPHAKPALQGWSGDTGKDPTAWLRGVVERFQLGKAQPPRTERPTVAVPVLQPVAHTTGGQLGEYVAPKLPRTKEPAPMTYMPKVTGPSTRRPTLKIPVLGKALTSAAPKGQDGGVKTDKCKRCGKNIDRSNPITGGKHATMCVDCCKEADQKIEALDKGTVTRLPTAAASPPVQPDRQARGKKVISLDSRRPAPVSPYVGDPDEYYRAATAAEDKGDLDTAHGLYEAALRANPGHAQSHINLGRIKHEAGDLEGALGHYDAAAAAKDPTAHFNRGVALEDLGRTPEAIQAYQQSLQAAPHADTHYNLARLLDLQGQTDQAMQHMTRHRQLRRPAAPPTGPGRPPFKLV